MTNLYFPYEKYGAKWIISKAKYTYSAGACYV